MKIRQESNGLGVNTKRSKSTFKVANVIALIFVYLFAGAQNPANQSHENYNPKKFTDFYEYVINQYIWLMDRVYFGNEPYFIIINDIDCNETYDEVSITMTYTRLGTLIKRIESPAFYVKEKDHIYVVFDQLCMHGYSKDALSYAYNIQELTDDNYNEYFLEKTVDRSYEGYYNDTLYRTFYFGFHENDIYEINKFDTIVSACKNGHGIVFFTDYKPKTNQGEGNN